MSRRSLVQAALQTRHRLLKTRVPASLFSTLFGVQALWAQTPPDESTAIALEPVVVTSTREVGGTPLSNVPGSVTVIEREELDRQASISNDLGDVIAKTVPGFSPSNEALSNFGQTLRGRNFLVLLDGVPQSTPLRDVARDLRTIDPAAIERIEVIRGSTAIYGFGAAGGIINIITRQPEEGEQFLSTTLGGNVSLTHPDDSWGGTLSQTAAGDGEHFDYLFSLTGETVSSFFDAEGDRIPPDPLGGQGGLADTNAFNLLGKVGVDFNQQRLQFTSNYYEIKQDTDFITQPGDLQSSQKAIAVPGDPGGEDPGNRDLNLNLEYRHQDLLGGDLAGQLYYQDLLRRFTFFPEFGQTQLEAERIGARLTHSLDVERFDSSLTYGIDLLSDRTRQPLIIDDAPPFTDARAPSIHQYSAAPFLQAEVPVGESLLLRGGVRYEFARLEVDDFTNLAGIPIESGELSLDEPLFNLGLVYFINDYSEAFASFSQGFSLADFGRVLADSTDPIAVENFDAAGQEVDNYELGLRGTWSQFDGALAFFYSESDLGTTFGGPPDFLIQRQPEEIYGVELTADYRFAEQWRVGGTATWLEGKVDTDADGSLDSYLDGTRISPPKYTAYVDYDPFPWWRNRLQLLYVHDRSRFGDGLDDNGDRIFGQGEVNDFTIVDLISEFDVGPGQLQVGIENLLNKQYFPVYAQIANDPTTFYTGQGARLYASYAVRY
jgi:iron complex outermembrane recepter protein